MAWLLRRGQVLASVSLASTLSERARGFAGRDASDGALYLSPARLAHSIGVRTALDVAYLGPDLTVVETRVLAPRRVSMSWGATGVLEAEAGAFERWSLRPGDQLEIKQ